ncbi:MAG: glycine--tRNA ligase [Planctomycetes bacterium]|nr:glycine--tRNA ligase [Planctomycetota bacterium]
MDKIVSLAKRRGFIFQSSEIYGGLNGFWDYGPLGVALKRNLKDCWWRDMVAGHDELAAPAGAPTPYEMTGLDCTIIMHPQVWKCSGHFDLFHDWMIDCRESKRRYRYDHLQGRFAAHRGRRMFVTTDQSGDEALPATVARAQKLFGLRAKQVDEIEWSGALQPLPAALAAGVDAADVLGPDASAPGTLTAPREFNLMFETRIGALAGDADDRAFLRPETAQGIFVNFKNVVDTSRVRVPFGIAQIGKSFRNEITPRNFTFRSREFEQMEIEFFCRPDDSPAWYRYWRDRRWRWYLDLGLTAGRLRLREHDADELSHYSCGTADIEYAFPFLAPGEFGELEGIAHRGDFDLRSHMEGKLVRRDGQLVVETGDDGKPRHRGSGKDLSYFDDVSRERYVPHVIEPSAGADRAVLAFLCDAYCEDEVPDEDGKPRSRTVLRLHPRLAPVKAAILPLVKKDGMPEVAIDLYRSLKRHMACQYDEKGSVGRRYARQDEAGTPWCLTIDGQTLTDRTVTLRDRDSLEQQRVPLDEVVALLRDRLG